ncbi:hypothetical protein AA313_de0206388 [Arthrobotrys entomopaga]|nr:hypothetical protein AA313_de0206388 [Arthrobotrys entomopaga]
MLFNKVIPADDTKPIERYYKAVGTLGKGGKVENLMRELLWSIQLLANFKILTATRKEEAVSTRTERNEAKIAQSLEDVSNWGPSVPDHVFEKEAQSFTVVGNNNNVVQGKDGKQANYNVSDKLLAKSIAWILSDPQYLLWKDGDEVCLLWIKGGADKGKTMISIGLIEQLSTRHSNASVAVTYYFCQNANYKLNTLESMIKGLILQLALCDKELKEPIRRLWDAKDKRFKGDVTSWKVLWDIFLEILQRCKSE